MKKSLVKNSIYSLIYRAISVLYPLIVVTYVSHIIMADGMGMVSYAQNIVSIFTVVAALGIPTYGIREIAVRMESKQERSNVFWDLFTINCISTSIAFLVYIVLIFSISKFKNQLALYLVTGLQLFFCYLNFDWFYQGCEEYRYISLRNIIVKMISLILILFLIRSSSDYVIYALISSLAIGGNHIFNLIHLKKYLLSPDRKVMIARHLKSIFLLLAVSIAVEIYGMVDITMLGIFCDDSTVGCYSNAMKLTRMVIHSIAAICVVFFPRLSAVFKSGDVKHFNYLVNSGIKIMLVFAIPSFAGLLLLSKDIVVVLFGNTFIPASPILQILAFMIPIVVCNTLLGGQVLITTGNEKKYVIAVVITSIVNITLNSLLIPRYGAPGAASASLISETTVLILYLFFIRKYVQLSFNFSYYASIIIPLMIYAVIAFPLINRIPVSSLSRIIINICVCVTVYFFIGIQMKNEAMLYIIDTARILFHR